MNALTEPSAAPPSPAEQLTSERHPLLLFFDGECNFCNHWVGRIRDADTARRIRFGTKLSQTFQRVAQAHPEVANVPSIVLVARRSDGHEEYLSRTPAIREAIAGLPPFRLFAFVLKIFPTPVANFGYAIVARFRRSLARRQPVSCRVPTAEDRQLYVD
jgi:predicted DCC family thiol-disulfide oxidoreductase YuxK